MSTPVGVFALEMKSMPTLESSSILSSSIRIVSSLDIVATSFVDSVWTRMPTRTRLARIDVCVYVQSDLLRLLSAKGSSIARFFDPQSGQFLDVVPSDCVTHSQSPGLTETASYRWTMS